MGMLELEMGSDRVPTFSWGVGKQAWKRLAKADRAAGIVSGVRLILTSGAAGSLSRTPRYG
jgi:hypothetical protein